MYNYDDRGCMLRIIHQETDNRTWVSYDNYYLINWVTYVVSECTSMILIIKTPTKIQVSVAQVYFDIGLRKESDRYN